MTIFSGLCIGGPYDGETHLSYEPHLKAYVALPASIEVMPAKLETVTVQSHVTYYYRGALRFPGGKEQNFWTLDLLLTAYDIVQLLIASYTAQAKARGRNS